MAMTTPYLDAIQAIPGDNPGEKFKWMSNFIREKLSVSDNLIDIVECDQIPRILAPLIHIQAAVTLIKKDPTNQNAYVTIAEALKSKDKMIVNKAFHASHFFDGTNTSITNVQYFAENIFPCVSLNTRARIVKSLAAHLSFKKDTNLAEEFFLSVETLYGVKQAMPLLLACSDSFVYNIVAEKKIVLSRQLVRQIFYKNPDLVVRYFKLGKPNLNPLSRNLHPVSIYNFDDILAQLVKKKLKSFVELCEMYERVPPTLNHKTAQLFLKNGKKYLFKKPQLYIKMLPLKKISNECMRVIYPKLFPKNIKDFNTDEMLKYLQYYPEERKTDFFLNSYQQVYGKNILDEPKKVTIKLMKILPPTERIRLAKIKLESESKTDCSHSDTYQVNCINFWDCYLSTDTLLPQLREEISKESEMKLRTIIACKMIYCCCVNKDNQALLEILTYLRNRHSNEQAWFIAQVFQTLLTLYDLPALSNEYWLVLRDMISNAYVRKTLMVDIKISVSMLEAAIHHNILRNTSIEFLIEILVDLKCLRKTSFWNILQKYPQYEKLCLEACINVFSQKYDQTPWKEDRIGILYDLCVSIYHFNKTHKHSRTSPIAIRDYPWMLTTLESVLERGRQHNNYVYQNLQNLLMKNDTELYERFWPDDKKVKILTGDVFNILKTNPREILTKWEDYLQICKTYWHKYHTRIFIKALRWYNDIPIKFAIQCFKDLSQANEMVCLNILAILVHGDTFSKIIEPLIPTTDVEHQEMTINYQLVQYITSSILLTDSPVSLSVLSKLCNLDSLSTLPTITNAICRKISAMDVMSFAETLCAQKVSVRKHGIRLIRLVASREYILNFLSTQWHAEQNQSIRQILFVQIIKLFAVEPGPTTWSLCSEAISTLTGEQSKMLSELIPMVESIPDEYVADYVKQLVDTIDTFEKSSLTSEQLAEYVSELLDRVNAAICNLLPNDFLKSLLQKYLLHQNSEVSKSSSIFVITSVLIPSLKRKFDERMDLFCDVFKEIITSGWDVPHPKQPRFYPVNNRLHQFVETVLSMFSFIKVEPRLIDKLLSTFVSVLEPHKEPTSYLLLIYCNEKIHSATPREFGSKLGKKLDDLIEIFSPFFMFFMADVLLNMPLLYSFDDYDKDDVDFEIIDGLLAVETVPATLLATKMLKSVKPDDQPERYDELIKKLLTHDSPAVKSSLCDIINNSKYTD